MTNEPASLTGRIRIKICGIRTGETALAAAEAGADAIGFVFHPGSQRFIEPEEAFQVMADLPPFVATVGLFVNATLEKFCEMEERCPTTLSQLHGDEPEDVVRQCGPGVIKAVHFDAETIESELARWSEVEEVDAGDEKAEILGRDRRDRDVVDVHLTLADEVEQQVEGPFENAQLDAVGVDGLGLISQGRDTASTDGRRRRQSCG